MGRPLLPQVTIGRPLTVALYSGLVVRGDAISNCVMLKLGALEALARAGEPVRTVVFTQGSDRQHDAIRRVATVHDLFRQPDFHRADIHIFEFGIRYDLFNAPLMISADRPVLAAYHNVTPPHLADTDVVRNTLAFSLKQKHNLHRADHVACDSEFNRDDLIAFGIPASRLSVLHLPPMITPSATRPPARPDVRLLYVGRFVAAKGVVDLLTAVATLVRRGLQGFSLHLVGNRRLSSQACIERLDELMRVPGMDRVVRFVESANDEAVAGLYASSDALVIPSYHEGFCVPVVEAFAAGCYVIAYDSSNLPNVVAGLGSTVPTGDVDALANALGEFVVRVRTARSENREALLVTAAGELPESEWRAAVAIHNVQYSRDNFDREFVRLVRWAADRRHGGAASPFPPADAVALAGAAGSRM